MATANNVTRFLDSHRIPYEAHELPPAKLGAVEAAQVMGVPPEQVFKTIVVIREPTASKARGKKSILAVVPGPSSVDLKQLAAFLGEKKVYLPTEREAEQLTGLQAGGISPLALINKGFQVVIDNSAQGYERIYISGGQRGLDILLPVEALARLTNARFGEVARAS
jgi:Cys-tRNA(Pro)/Cys-tRNA(Cys) deacylase